MSSRDVAVAIQYLSGTKDQDTVVSMDATVMSVDIPSRTCVCETIGGKSAITYPDVRLMSSVDDGILIIPTKDSNVTIIVSTFAQAYVSGYSAVDSIVLRGGDLGGLVKLLTALSSFNKIEQDINNLKTAFQAWSPISGDGGAALKVAAGVWFGQPLTETQREDLENTAITQG